MKKLFIRSIFNLGDFNDNEKNSGVSLTDPTDNASTEALITKLLNGESLQARYVPEYDIPTGMSNEEAFTKIDITKNGDFDLSDVARIRAAEQEKQRHSKKVMSVNNKASQNNTVEVPVSGTPTEKQVDSSTEAKHI